MSQQKNTTLRLPVINSRSHIHYPNLCRRRRQRQTTQITDAEREEKMGGAAGESPLSSFCSNFWASARRTKTLTPPHSSDASSSSVRTSSGDSLVRRLGLFDLILLGIGASIGAGIFVVTGTVARDTGPAVTISFLLAGASCILNALCYAELASRFPAVVGGAYMYTYSAFNEITAFLVFTQLMLDYHIGAASIARSLASYVVNLLELIPFLKGNIPSWIGNGGTHFLGVFSINVLAPILLVLLTVVLCQGVGESSTINCVMTMTKVLIVITIIIAGSFEVDVSNWSPFAPNGVEAILTGATVVFFAYVGFDAVANSAEESKRPQRDLPIGIMGSLLVCIALYVGVCLVITGMVPYQLLSDEAPLAAAFTAKGLKFVSVLISVGAVAGLTTTLLVGLYVQVTLTDILICINSLVIIVVHAKFCSDIFCLQSRLYLGLGRDGLLPQIFAKVNPVRHTPIQSQTWVGLVACVLAGLFNVSALSHILSVGTLTGYSVVAACLVTLRFEDKSAQQVYTRWSRWTEGVVCLAIIASCGFIAGAIYRFGYSYFLLVIPIVVAIAASAALFLRQGYAAASGFSCPGVPILPAVCIFFNIFLFAQLHIEAWARFVFVSIITVGVYAFYGQYHANPNLDETVIYHRVPE